MDFRLDASGQAAQAYQYNGTQINNFHGARPVSEEWLSLAAPLRDGPRLRGRDALLDELAEARKGTGPRTWVLHGLGGGGKTSVAAEAAARLPEGTDVWWLSANDKGRFEGGIRALARILGISDEELRHGHLPDLLWGRLSARTRPWLLVIDNADDPGLLQVADDPLVLGRGWVRPPAPNGFVLVTTRDGGDHWWKAAWCSRREIRTLPKDPAAEVLLELAGTEAGPAEDARRLASRLGGLPLALRLVGNYLAQAVRTPVVFADPGTVRTFADYQELLATDRPHPLIPSDGRPMDQQQARRVVGATWELSLDLLEQRGFPEARPLHALLARFEEAPIPYELLLSPEVMAADPLFPGLSGPRLWQALRSLADLGLIDLRPEDGTLALHPLVRDAGRRAVRAPSALTSLACSLLDRAVRSGRIGSPEDPAHWSAWKTLSPHVRHLFLEVADMPEKQIGALCAAAWLCANWTHATGRYAEAETEFREIFAAQSPVLGADHPDTLATRHNIAFAMDGQGRHAEAEAEFREVLSARLRVLGADHPSTLATRHNIAYAMDGQGRHAEAEAEFREVLAIGLRVLGADHPDTLITRHNIALAAGRQGRHAEAEAEFRKVLSAQLRLLGADHPDTLITRHNIALAIGKQQRHAEAEAECRDVLTAQVRVLGADHPHTLSTRHVIAQLMMEQGRRAEALAEFRDVLEAKIQILGPDHASTRATRSWIEEYGGRVGGGPEE